MAKVFLFLSLSEEQANQLIKHCPASALQLTSFVDEEVLSKLDRIKTIFEIAAIGFHRTLNKEKK